MSLFVCRHRITDIIYYRVRLRFARAAYVVSRDDRDCLGPGRLTLSFVVVFVVVIIVVVVVAVVVEVFSVWKQKETATRALSLSGAVVVFYNLCFVKWYDLGKSFWRVWYLLFTGRRLRRIPAIVIIFTGDARALLLCYRKSTRLPVVCTK